MSTKKWTNDPALFTHIKIAVIIHYIKINNKNSNIKI